MRDRLIELCENLILSCKSSLCEDCEHKNIDYPNCMSVHFADHLLASGVIVLPCKVGTYLYLSDYFNMHFRLKEYKFCGNRIAFVIDCWEWQRTCTRWLDDFGKTVFLTREEAEQALKRGEG